MVVFCLSATPFYLRWAPVFLLSSLDKNLLATCYKFKSNKSRQYGGCGGVKLFILSHRNPFLVFHPTLKIVNMSINMMHHKFGNVCWIVTPREEVTYGLDMTAHAENHRVERRRERLMCLSISPLVMCWGVDCWPVCPQWLDCTSCYYLFLPWMWDCHPV